MIGFAMCGSYCTHRNALEQLGLLRSLGVEIQPIMSENVYTTDTHFGRCEELRRQVLDLCGRPIIHTVVEAEPLGPRTPLDALLICPCTGNTLAKIALGITAGALAILIGLFGLVQLFLNNKKDTEEYRMAYSYLIGSSAFQQMHAEESDIRLNQYALRTHTGTEDHFSSGQTVEITFTVIYRSFTVICHKQDGHWVVCEYCTQFE
jgi:hypothetical protein